MERRPVPDLPGPSSTHVLAQPIPHLPKFQYVRLGQDGLVKQWVSSRIVIFLKDQFRKCDTILCSTWTSYTERKEHYLTRHKTLPVSPFLLLSEVGFWARSTSIAMFRCRDLGPFEPFLRLPGGVGWSVDKSSSIFTLRTGLRESTQPKPWIAFAGGVAANRV